MLVHRKDETGSSRVRVHSYQQEQVAEEAAMSDPRVWNSLMQRRRLVLKLALIAGPAAGVTAHLGRPAPKALARPARPYPIGPEPEPRGARPSGFTPYAGASIADGAQLALFLNAQGRVLLVVEQLPPGSDDRDPNGPPPNLVGLVPLGLMMPGPNFVPWDYIVNGQVLGPGNYFIHVTVATANDQPTGATAPTPWRLGIGADGSVQVQLAVLLIHLVNQDGSVTLLNPDGSPL
jgi:hypothetical protein